MFEAGDGKGGYMEALIVEQDKGDAIGNFGKCKVTSSYISV